MKYSLRHIAWAAFLAAVILLVGIGVAAYRTTRGLVANERSVSRTREVQLALEEICSDSLRANNARRGYILSGDEAMLKGYDSAIAEVPGDLQRLRQLTSDNPDRLPQLNTLQATLDRHLALLQKSLEVRKSGGPDAQLQKDITLQSAQLSEQLRSQVKSMQREEISLLQERRKAADVTYRHMQLFLVGAFVLALLLLGAEFYSLNLEFTKRERSERVARQSQELVNAFFSSSTVGFAILDSDFRYRRANRVLAAMVGMTSDDILGKSIRHLFPERADEAERVLRAVLSQGEAVLDREVSGVMLGESRGLRHWLVNYFPIRDNNETVTQIGIIAVDVSERRNAENAIRRLSARLLTLQDQERRRIARDLHDGLGQYLVGLKISIEMLANPAIPDKSGLIDECSQILERCVSESRTLSHLLHPPLLDEAGFASAASWFVSGFSQRSGIEVKLDLPANLPRLPGTIEIALFRVLQEALTNVHRHSHSKSGEIRLQVDAEQVVMEVQDHGPGIPSGVLEQLNGVGPSAGVGLAGMRERVHELGGRFAVESDKTGTTIRVSIPLPAEAEPAEPVYFSA